MQIHTLDLNFQHKAEAIAAFVVQTEQTAILIETGAHATFTQLTAGIEKKGLRWQDIAHVFITHIHLDHAGAAWALAEQGATIYLHPFGYAHMANPEKLMESARRIYQDQMDTLWGDMRAIAPEKLVTVAHEQVVDIADLSIKAWHTPGHAHHHIAWQISDAVFTGDVAGVKVGNGPVVAPCPPPDIDIEKWLNSIALLKKMNARTFYLTHFGKITDIDSHLKALEENLWKQARWIKQARHTSKNISEITHAFDHWAKQELVQLGLSPDLILSYQLANPAWMSVAGLMRYWDKKDKEKNQIA